MCYRFNFYSLRGIPKTPEQKVSAWTISDKGGILAYAYLKDGDKLVGFSKTYLEPKKDEEIIKITRSGFYPNYKLPRKQIDGQSFSKFHSLWNVFHQKNAMKVFAHDSNDCIKSFYLSRSVGNVGMDAVTTTFFTFMTVGFYVFTLGVPDYMHFDKEFFTKAIKENRLGLVRDKLLNLNKISNKNKQSLKDLYINEDDKYSQNRDLIKISYKLKDDSGLF